MTDGPRHRPTLEDLALGELLTEFSHRLDMERGASVHELFTADGTFALDGDVVHGRAAIRLGYERRAARGPRTARHLVSNVRVRFASDRRAHVRSILVLYAEDGTPPHAAQAPLLVADVDDVCVRGSDELWSFESRDLRSLFRSAAALVTPAGVS
jgi:hypothetical protein